MNQNLHYIKRKSFILYLLVNIVTCGLYSFFVNYQFAIELSNENPERRTINPIGLMFIAIIPIVGPIIWISQITSRMTYTVQKYSLPISLKTGVIKTLYIIGNIGFPIFYAIGLVTFFVTDDIITDILVFVSIGAWLLASASGICMLVAMFLLFDQYNNLADALSYVPGASMPQMDMYNQPMNNHFVQQPGNMQPQMDMQAQNVAPMDQMQPQSKVAVTNQMTENNQLQDN